MKRLAVLLALLTVVACQDVRAPLTPSDAEPAASARASGPHPEAIPGRYIVVFHDAVADAPGLARSLAARYGGTVHFSYEHALKGFAANLPERAVAALRAHPQIAYLEQDQVVTTLSSQSNATWGLDRIDQRNLPLNSTYNYKQTGAGVNAYIIDTGIRYTHNEFEGRARPGTDVFNDGRNGDDCNGHGTHVAGTVGGRLYGVAKLVRLYAVRVLDCAGSGTASGVIQGVDWVTANHVKPAVANMSLGGGASDALDQAVRNSINAGVSYAIAAGNGFLGLIAMPACDYSPARVREAMTVSATTNTDAKVSWANQGECVDMFAPGVSITSAWHTSNTATSTISGTSMAAPHVAGVAALYLQTAPTATPAQVFSAINAQLTLNKVTSANTAKNHLLYSYGWDSSGGGDPPPGLPAPSDLTATSNSTSQITVKWTDNSSEETGFEVQRYAGNGNWTTIATRRANSISYKDTGLQEATRYTYRVRALGSSGNSSWSNEASNSTRPAAPSNLAAVKAASSINLSWTNNSVGASSFTIQRSVNGGSFRSLATVAASVTSYSDTGVRAGNTYAYRVRAANEGGNSDWSNTSNTVSW